MNGSYLGNEFNQEEIEKELTSIGANFETLEYNDLVTEHQMFCLAKKRLLVPRSNGVCPRALGGRSLVIRDLINAKTLI